MTRTSNTFGALAMTILTVFALWTSTLANPAAPTTQLFAATAPGKAAA